MSKRKVKNFMTKSVITLPKTATVSDVINEMTDKVISCVVIVNRNKKPIGIVTERDLVKKVLIAEIKPDKTKISQIMSSPLITMKDDTNLFDVMAIMQKHGFRRVIITNSKKELAGIVTQTDFFKVIKELQKELEAIDTKSILRIK